MGNCSTNCNPCGPSYDAINLLANKTASYARQANTYAVNAENSWLEFNALYLGAFAVAPATDNEGNALQEGALYYNTATNNIWAWNGTAWVLTNNFNEFTNFVSNGTTATRSLVQRFGEISNVSDFGADGTGATPSNAAVVAMAAAKGYLVFPQGSFLLNTITISVPIYFEMGSNITASNGSVITIENSIESPRQYIFQKIGNGSYDLQQNPSTKIGENARQVHASWFGAFPQGDTGVNVAPNIQDACNALGNTRESQILFDIGNYQMKSGVLIGRGCNIVGTGIRRTVFRVEGDGFPVFTTNNVAVFFTDIQFELHPNNSTRTTEYIRIDHDDSTLFNIYIGRTFKGIVVNGNNCNISRVTGVWDANQGAGSSAIEVNAGQCTIENIRFESSTFGPESIINIAGGAIVTISSISIRGLQYRTPSIGILFDGTSASITGCYVDGFIYRGFSGTNPYSAIYTRTFGSNSISDIVFNGGTISGYATNGITLEQNSASGGETIRISINDFVISGASGNGIQLIKTAGRLSDISIGAGTNIIDRATPIYVSGGIQNIKIDPNALPNAKNATCYDFTIDNDSVASINLFQSIFTGFLLVSVTNDEYGMYMIRAANNPSITTINQSANMNPVIGVLTGTTGPVGDFSVGITDGKIYLENRTGISHRISANILTGV